MLRGLPLLFLLVSCQPCEGPIVVYLDGMDDTAEVTWAEAGSEDFQPCRPGIAPAYADCGPDDDEASGSFTVRVTWNGEVYEEEVALQSDNSCTGNTTVTLTAEADTAAG